GYRAEAGLRGLLDLHPALHPLTVLRLRLRIRRLPRELALRPLRGGSSEFRGEVLRHAESRRLQAPLGAIGPLRPRRPPARVLAKRSERHRADDRRAGGVGPDRVSGREFEAVVTGAASYSTVRS